MEPLPYDYNYRPTVYSQQAVWFVFLVWCRHLQK